MADGTTNYETWTKASLIAQLKRLEAELKRDPVAARESSKEKPKGGTEETAGQDGQAKTPKGKRKMDPSKYSTRYIALKLAYLGKRFGGFEHQTSANQPSIEEELFQALTKACLIFPEDERVVDWESCEYSKCGRTDRGVSAFGQVIGLRVRSNRPLPKKRIRLEESDASTAATNGEGEGEVQEEVPEKPFDSIRDEIAYPRILNRLLPPEIRVIAWCPSPPPDFSARFSCRERQYRYFFTQPAFSPEPTNAGHAGVKPGWLNIETMREAAKRFEGEHDFRNVCKIDPAKLITNFSRTIFESDIVEVKDVNSALPYLQRQGFAPEGFQSQDGVVYPKVYYFHVRGSAFLWHQIRHMVAILFLVGQGLEPPSVVSDILDVEKTPGRPNYVMADEVPLVLWDCIFPDLSNGEQTPVNNKFQDTMQWVYVGDEGGAQGKSGQFGQWGVLDGIWQTWREKKMDELLANQLLQHMSGQLLENTPGPSAPVPKPGTSLSARVFEGGNSGRSAGKYVPIMKKDRLQPPDEQNDRYAQRKGYADAQDMRDKKFKSSKDTVLEE